MAATARPANEAGRVEDLRWAVADGLAMSWRNLLHAIRVPELLVFSTIQPGID
jgi:hypothetical protein